VKLKQEHSDRNQKQMVSREFEEVEGGFYDEMNFYILPNEKGTFHISQSL